MENAIIVLQIAKRVIMMKRLMNLYVIIAFIMQQWMKIKNVYVVQSIVALVNLILGKNQKEVSDALIAIVVMD